MVKKFLELFSGSGVSVTLDLETGEVSSRGSLSLHLDDFVKVESDEPWPKLSYLIIKYKRHSIYVVTPKGGWVVGCREGRYLPSIDKAVAEIHARLDLLLWIYYRDDI